MKSCLISKVRFGLAACILFQSVFGFGQEPAYLAITGQQGLPSNTVYDIYQDGMGFLWVATENGLARFNGAQFYRYTNPGIRSLAVSGILEDDRGRIWAHNFFGEIVYVEDDSLKRLESWESRYQKGFPTISFAGNRFWISTLNQLYEYNVHTGKWRNLDSANKQNRFYSHHFATHKGELWMTYSEPAGVTVASETGRKMFFPASQYDMRPNMQMLFEWENQVWMFDRQQQKVYNLNNRQDDNSVFASLISKGPVRSIKNVNDSLLAFIRSDGVSLLSRANNTLHLAEGKNISSIAADAEGGLWVGTLNEGLLYFPVLSSILYSREKGFLYRRLLYDKNSRYLYAGNFHGGVDVFSDGGKLTKRLVTPGKREVQSLWVDSLHKRLLVFTDKLYVYSIPAYQLENILAVPAVKKIIEVENFYVLATSGGLLFLDKETFTKRNFFDDQRISVIAYDNLERQIWVGTQKGVYIVNPLTGEKTPWYPRDTLAVGLSTIYYYPPYVVLGTQNNGIYLLRNRKVERHLNVPEGNSTQYISCLLLNRNNLYAGGDQGVVIWDFNTGTSRYFNKTKGLVSDEVYDIAWVDNKLWVSGTDGLQHLGYSPNPQIPKLYLQRVWSADSQPEVQQDGYVFPPDTRQLSIQFDVANNLKNLGGTRIFYRIRELEANRWNETNLYTPVASYLALPSGKLTLEAYAMNEDGITSQTRLLSITIRTPFWKKGWFLIVMIVIALSLIGTVVYYRFQQITKRNRRKLLEEKREQDLRIAQLTSLRAQMNPHFIFNTLASIQGRILGGFQQKAVENIEHFSALLRKVLDLSSRELILLTDEVDVLEKYLAIEQDRFDGSLHYSIEVDEALRNEVIRIPSLITQPFVENALRHGLMHKQGEKKLSIRFLLRENSLVIEIEDNGVGRRTSAEINKLRGITYRSFAMDAYRKRIDLLNASRQHKIDLNIVDHVTESGMPAGTTVQLILPLGYALN